VEEIRGGKRKRRKRRRKRRRRKREEVGAGDSGGVRMEKEWMGSLGLGFLGG
jgi:hypothetical protein